MFNRAWIYLALLLIPVGLLFDVGALLTISAFLLTIVPIAWWWNRHCLDGVEYERSFSEQRAFPGEVVELALRVSNQKLLPLGWLIVEDHWSLALPPEDVGSQTPALFPTTGRGDPAPTASGERRSFRSAFSIRWFEQIRRCHKLRCTRRGFYPFGPARFESGDIFGLFRQSWIQDKLDWLIVYPQIMPLEALGFPRKEPFGEIKADWRIFEDPSRAVGVRDHQPQDSFRHIHWKATARRQDLQVKVYEPTTGHNLVVFLNVATFPRHWQGVDPVLLEKTISVAASIASHACEQRYLLGFLANGCLPHADQPIKVLPSRRPDQLTRVLEALAAVTSFATCSIESLLLTESPRLPWGATLVVVTAIVPTELQAALLRLQDVGRRLALVSVVRHAGRPPPSLPGILTYHLAASELPFDEMWMGEPEVWAPEFSPPFRFTGAVNGR